jgi:hypothetical protein
MSFMATMKYLEAKEALEPNIERGSQNNIKMAVKTTLSPITQCAMPLQSRTPK